jgi:hypothetical protein
VQLGPGHPAFLAVNNTVLVLSSAGIGVLWAQSGLRARDAALLGGALGLYDLVATALLPLMDQLLAHLAAMPLIPVIAWGSGVPEGRVSLGLGDLILATVFPLVQRKAYGRAAGLAALASSLCSIALLLLLAGLGWLRGSFPVMVVLGPLCLVQWAASARWCGSERTTGQYLQQATTSSWHHRSDGMCRAEPRPFAAQEATSTPGAGARGPAR